MFSPGADPAFPEDLERRISESAAFFHTPCIPALLLVAHRVRIWIEPLFYKVVTIYGLPHKKARKPNTNFRHSVPALYSLIKSKPASFFPDNVRHVQVIGVPIAEILAAFAACNATTSLALFDVSCVKGDAALLELLGVFPLKRFSARANYWLCPGGWDFGHPLFEHITHLDLPGDFNCQGAKWSSFALIPRLTHLSFSEDMSLSESFPTILEHCKSLQVLAMVYSSPAMLKFIVLATERQPSSFDPRVVLLAVADRQADWETGARGADDYWIAAERLVDKQRAGDFHDFAQRDFSEDDKKDLAEREWFCQIA
ncbi:hypothetical protein B0H16DRAFT_1563428 [Mycena metata]|uniref:Uncharacterized protein n=1 Tax=Mycena metata TaxID=1033252 RepID=A0AAD7N2B9_9AGAR|nr:hypothetical protein B0H16DRAFT_1563428 [Mycena metata]